MLHSQKFHYLSESSLNKDYRDVTKWLFNQFPSYQIIGSKAYKPTLQNSLAIAAFLGDPQQKLNFIHVAGSNGKGSTCSMLASILTEAGYKVGLFTSPHIKDFRERIRINGVPISENEVVSFVHEIQQQKLAFDPSFFEITFGLALQHFEKEDCDICIIETGLGGRLDATNIITPVVSVITNISLEHTQILGNSIEEIAMEKSGIIKPNIPVVFGKMNLLAQKTLIEEAKKNRSTFYLAEKDPQQNYTLPLLGAHQEENFQTVLSTLNLLVDINFNYNDDIIQRGLNNIFTNSGLTGRLQVISRNPLIIYDVSHNPEGIKTSLEAIAEINKGELHIIYGSSSDKDIASIISMFPEKAKYYFTEFTSDRCAKVSELRELSENKLVDIFGYFESPLEALKQAKANTLPSDTIIVIGSFFLISDFY